MRLWVPIGVATTLLVASVAATQLGVGSSAPGEPATAPPSPPNPPRITSLGRIEPRNGVSGSRGLPRPPS